MAGVQNKSTINETKEQIYNTMLKDLTNGCVEDISVKAGFIGEVGSCWPIHGITNIQLSLIHFNLHKEL